MRPVIAWRPQAFLAWGAGSLMAILAHLFAPQISEAVVGLLVGGLVYAVIERVSTKPTAIATEEEPVR